MAHDQVTIDLQAYEDFEKSEDWAEYRDHEKREMAFAAGIRHARAQQAQALAALASETREINQANGWNCLNPDDWRDAYRVPAILALIHSEVSEALEDFRHDKRDHFNEEVADILIRCFDLAAGLGIDLDAAVRNKLMANRQRGHRHGGKRV